MRLRLACALGALVLFLGGCGPSGLLRGDSLERVYAASVEDVLEGVQRAAAQTRSVLVTHERTPSGHVLRAEVRADHARSGQRRSHEFLAYTVFVEQAGALRTRVKLDVPPTASYGGSSPAAFAESFFTALERSVPRADG